MSYPFTLGSLDPFWVADYDGFDLPDDVSVVKILGDGTSPANAVLQSGGVGLPAAALTGYIFEEADVAVLRGYRASEEIVTFTEPGGDHSVVITQLAIKQDRGMPWRWSATMIELPPEGS